MQPFTSKVISVIKDIPPGKVMTYGQIAGCAGSPRGARQVVRILHTMSKKYELPWHRVVNIKGEIAIKDREHADYQQFLLEREGVKFTKNLVVDLTQYKTDTMAEY
ncbi:MGMT family protein [Cytobacillus purgationiresistens]|uniref:Methylated-DNA-protein-cysteine methyltransferase-like protein n=1 Tax=Cytobacillus purgationiresistens TaxID=863449 RepID=A0ABU0AB35_9BACI|nr:MGMT family protein [Cytobacillus purgationiresistens]MDQ0268467.1 methylated-DNA-protein-cysteine methyltransferase-like protein [Cytobacillus purgationiresistens]